MYNPGMPSRERSFRVEAVVLRHNNWGEADRMLGLFTARWARSAPWPKASGGCARARQATWSRSPASACSWRTGRDILIVTQAETVNPFLPLREDLALVGCASYVIELLDRFTYEEGENPSLYRLLVDTLARLAEAQPPDRVLRYYEIRLLDLLGFRPQLLTCARCGKDIQPEDQYFSAEHGGVLCPACGRGIPGVRPVSMQALKFLRHYQRSSYNESARAQIPAPIYQEMEALMQYYLTYILERGLNTPAFMRRIKRDREMQG